MSETQKQQFNRMRKVLKNIANGYQSTDQLRRFSEKDFGLDYTDALEMSYDNIKILASDAVRGVKEIKINPPTP